MSESTSKKRKYQHKHCLRTGKRFQMQCGQRGFLITHSHREKSCSREALNLLTQYANQLYGSESESKSVSVQLPTEISEDNDHDIIDDLRNEVTAGKRSTETDKKRRFQEVYTGSPHILFIHTQLEKPTELVDYIIKDISDKKEAKTRYLLRLLPIETVCPANCNEIAEACKRLCDHHFSSEVSTTFAIVFERRYNSNNKIIKDEIVDKLAELIHSKNPANKVDLRNAAKTIIVEIIKGFCCLSILDNYIAYRKYNLHELCK